MWKNTLRLLLDGAFECRHNPIVQTESNERVQPRFLPTSFGGTCEFSGRELNSKDLPVGVARVGLGSVEKAQRYGKLCTRQVWCLARAMPLKPNDLSAPQNLWA